jgi:POT family proton-dependent oligopeptide transporter
VSPDVAKKNFVKHCGIELVESLLVSVGLEAAEIEALWESFDDKRDFFLLNFGLVMGAALLLFLMLRWLNSVMKENNVL